MRFRFEVDSWDSLAQAGDHERYAQYFSGLSVGSIYLALSDSASVDAAEHDCFGTRDHGVDLPHEERSALVTAMHAALT